MKTLTSPRSWALLTVVVGFSSAHLFLRKPPQVGPDPPSENPRASFPAPPFLLGAAGPDAASAQPLGRKVSAQRLEASNPVLEKSAFENVRYPFPDWVKRQSKLDELIADKPEPIPRDSEFHGMPEISAWVPESEGASSHRALDVHSDETSYLMWPDRAISTSLRNPSFAKRNAAGGNSVRDARVSAGAGVEKVHSHIGGLNIRAGPGVTGSESVSPLHPGPAGNRGTHIPVGHIQSTAVFDIERQTMSKQLASPRVKAEVADRKKRFVFQPGYRPDD